MTPGIQIVQNGRVNCFGDGCVTMMDFFLKHSELYFTPKTVSLSMPRSLFSAKDQMQQLYKNSYLSKLSKDGTVYFITDENSEFWITDFKNYVRDYATKIS